MRCRRCFGQVEQQADSTHTECIDCGAIDSQINNDSTAEELFELNDIDIPDWLKENK